MADTESSGSTADAITGEKKKKVSSKKRLVIKSGQDSPTATTTQQSTSHAPDNSNSTSTQQNNDTTNEEGVNNATKSPSSSRKSNKSREKRASRGDLVPAQASPPGTGAASAAEPTESSDDTEQFFTPTATPPIESASRIMTEEEEAELIKLRRDRESGGRTRRGAFYGGNPVTEKKIGLDHQEKLDEPANSASGMITINSALSKSQLKNGRFKSKSKRLQCGFADTVGRRPSMEDDFVFVGQFQGKANMDLVGLFDGHRGPEAAKFAARELSGVVSRNMKHTDDPTKLLRQAFLDIHTAMKGDAITAGTTALVGLVTQDKLYVANAGDSRAVLAVRGAAKRLTTDHRPDSAAEIARITKLGGDITNMVTREGKVVARVKGQLAVSRALGDFDLEPFVTAEPEVVTVELDDDSDANSFVVLACDGVWEVITDQEAVDIAKHYVEQADVEQACKRLRDVAYARGSTDNITVVIIKLLAADELLKQGSGDTSKKSWCSLL